MELALDIDTGGTYTAAVILVGLSTILVANALAEGQRSMVCRLLIGYEHAEQVLPSLVESLAQRARAEQGEVQVTRADHTAALLSARSYDVKRRRVAAIQKALRA